MRAKAGYLTTEFWLTVAVNLAALIAAIQSYLPPRYAAIAGTIATGLYALSRGVTKSNTAAPSLPPSLPKLVVQQPAPPDK